MPLPRAVSLPSAVPLPRAVCDYFRVTAARPRRSTALPWTAAAVLVVAAAGCVVGVGQPQQPRQVDLSWAPLEPPGQLMAMVPTLVPHTEQQMQLPLFNLHQQVLPSGLRLGVETGETGGMVAVVTVVGTGSGADPPDHEGLAHLVEHLVYHARAKTDRPESDRLIRLGAHYNAGTTVDVTRYYEVVPVGSLPDLLDLVTERIQRPLGGVDEADFERERAIVENELTQRTETGVYGQVITWMQTSFLPVGHPFARPIGGTRASLQRLTLADARAFVAEHYRPSNVALLVTGEPPVTLARVASRLPNAVAARNASGPHAPGSPAGSMQAAASPAPPPPAQPPRPQARPDKLTAAVALPEIWIAYDVGGGGYDSAIAKILTSRAAESAVKDRLMPEREVLDVAFHAIGLPGRTVLACQIQLENTWHVAQIAESARDLIWRAWSDAPPPAAEGWFATWQWQHQNPVLDLRQAALADAIFAAEPFVDRTLDRALDFQTTGAIESYDRVLATIAAVQPGDLSQRARQLLAPARARTMLLEPIAQALRTPPGPVGVAGSDNQPLAMTRLHAAELGAPPPVAAPAGLADAKVMTLLNGMTVVLVPRRQFPSVTAVLGFHGGAAAMPPAVLEVVRIVEPQLAQVRNPARLEVVHADGRGFTADYVRTDRRRLSNALFSLADRIKMIAETDWASLLSSAQARLRHAPAPKHEEPRAFAAQFMLASLYRNHPYGRRVGVPELLALDPELAPAWLPRLYNPRNAFLVIVGDFDPNAAAGLVSGWFGSWQARPDAGRLTAPPVPAPDVRPTPQVSMTVVHRPVASQTEVAFACRLAYPTTGRERGAQDFIEGLLGGYLSSRIREQAGAAYSVSSSAAALPGGGAHLTVAMTVDTHRLRDALHVLRAEITGLAAGHVDKGAFSQVRWTLARKAALDYQTGLDTAARIVDAFTLGQPIEALSSDLGDLGRVSEQDVARVFAPCISTQVLTLIGDEPTIRASM